jgi:hypothetical protein
VLRVDEIGREPQLLWEFVSRLLIVGVSNASAVTIEPAAAYLTRDDAVSLTASATSALWALLRCEADGNVAASARVVPSAAQIVALREAASLVLQPRARRADARVTVGGGVGGGGDNDDGTDDNERQEACLNAIGTLGALGARATPTPADALALLECLAALLGAHAGDGMCVRACTRACVFVCSRARVTNFDTLAVLVAEVLNAVFDCFAIDDYNAILATFLVPLRQFEPHLRALLGGVAHDEMLAERLDEACDNLRAFIAYKDELI